MPCSIASKFRFQIRLRDDAFCKSSTIAIATSLPEEHRFEEDCQSASPIATAGQDEAGRSSARSRSALRRQYRSHPARRRVGIRREELRSRLDSRYRGACAHLVSTYLLLPAQQGRAALPDLASCLRGA